MMRFSLLFLVFMAMVSCQSETATKEKSLTEIKAENQSIRNSAIIKNPVSADQPTDTTNVAKMEFEDVRHRYGEVEEGAIVTHTWKFKNTGKAPLIISNCKSTCGCTVPEWPKEPIPVGGTGEIFVKFDTKHKENYQTKPIFITANTHPSETTLYLMGKVKKKVEE